MSKRLPSPFGQCWYCVINKKSKETLKTIVTLNLIWLESLKLKLHFCTSREEESPQRGKGAQSLNFPDGKFQRTKKFRTKCVNHFCDKKMRKIANMMSTSKEYVLFLKHFHLWWHNHSTQILYWKLQWNADWASTQRSNRSGCFTEPLSTKTTYNK